ncbi:MAG: hypothetical protein GXO77_14880 [Calditrichaeota bacterium]|nr:hypothetical protein [Calditrichota bacterium]
MKNDKAFNRLRELIDSNQRFFLVSHIYTDGDALGSVLSMYHYLKRENKEVDAAVPGELPERYDFLRTREYLNRLNKAETLKRVDEAEVIIILDISSLERMDYLYEPVMNSKAFKICIDHHPDGCHGVDLKIIDQQRVATAEIIFEYFNSQQVEITYEIALALYTGILSDSGGFRFEGTSYFTLDMAAQLAKMGIDPSWIYRQVYEYSNKKQLRFWGHILSNLQSDDRVDWAVVQGQTLKQFKVGPEELNGVIDIIRRDASANVFVMFVEKNSKEVMVGLRSRDGFDVGAIARRFGGGGHFHAAGFSSSKPLNEVVKETLTLIKKNQ